MSVLVVYAKAGVTIPSDRLVRFTGNKKAPCGWEIDLPAAGQRAHAVTRAGTTGTITEKEWGQAETFGPLVFVEVSTATSVDDELTTAADGRLTKAGAAKHRTAVAIGNAAKDTKCPVLLGWSQLP